MDMRLIALKCVLDELGVDIRGWPSAKNHELVQRAICLVQMSGVHLGYYYGWYGSNLQVGEPPQEKEGEDG